MSIKGIWKKFFDDMRLDDDYDYFDEDYSSEESKKGYCAIDFNNNTMIILPDGGVMFRVVRVGTNALAGIAVISKDKSSTIVPTTIYGNLLDDDDKKRLEDFLQKICDALKA